MPDRPDGFPAPLEGKTIVLVHPAWHSCGSHRVFVSQAEAYRALGATVVALAVHDTPASLESPARASYLTRSDDLVAARRVWTAMPWSRVLSLGFLRALGRRARGDHATLRLAVAARATVPRAVLDLATIDLVHCNHFFCMPVAERVAASANAPILLDSHDMQARQYGLANATGWAVPPIVSFEAMLAIETEAMGRADLLVHLNDDEDRAFRAILPLKRHALVYPSVGPLSTGCEGAAFVIIAAANHANVASVDWFLRAVVPLAPGLPYRIVGTVGREIKRLSPALYRRHAALFTDRVDDIQAVYDSAAAIMLPTVAGHGISIKTIEALSTGTRLIATTQAFRGMGIDPSSLGNVSLADDATTFASALRAVAVAPGLEPAGSDTRRLYERLFSPEAYRTRLAAALAPLLKTGS